MYLGTKPNQAISTEQLNPQKHKANFYSGDWDWNARHILEDINVGLQGLVLELQYYNLSIYCLVATLGAIICWFLIEDWVLC